MRISDWSSDVCSSDLAQGRTGPRQKIPPQRHGLRGCILGRAARRLSAHRLAAVGKQYFGPHLKSAVLRQCKRRHRAPAGAAKGSEPRPDRKSGGGGKGWAGRVVPGGRRILQKK